jgi:ferredoxin-NADP reductase
MLVTFDHHEEIAPGIFSFYFVPEEQPRHIAGQFIEFNLKHDNPDSRGIRRWFTISSAPEDKYLTITTRFFDKNSSTFKKALMKTKPGTLISFSPLEGDFVLPKDPETHLVFVAGGIGITPIHSMVDHLRRTEQKRDVTLLYGVNTVSDAIFADVFENYDMKTTLLVSKPDKGWQGASGNVNADAIIENLPKEKPYLIYLSGPEPMVETLDKDLRYKGISNKNIKTDFFPGYNTI